MEDKKLGFWDFLHLNKPLKTLLGFLTSSIIFFIFYLIYNGYKIETKYGSITPPQVEKPSLNKPSIKSDTVWKTKIIKEIKPVNKIVYRNSYLKKDSSIISNKDTKVTPTVNVTSNNQTGGITAQNVAIGKFVPELTEQLKESILSNIDDKNKNIRISYISGVENSMELAFKIKQFLESSGYLNISFSMMMSGSIPKGIICEKKNGEIRLVVGEISK